MTDSPTRACEVRAHVRKLPQKKCGIDNAIHEQLRAEIATEAALEEWATEFPRLCDGGPVL